MRAPAAAVAGGCWTYYTRRVVRIRTPAAGRGDFGSIMGFSPYEARAT